MATPVLTKIEGDDDIAESCLVRESPFLIGRSGKASLHLSNADVLNSHCTLEKVSDDKWIVQCHDGASIERNDEIISSGRLVLLRCGDLLGITSQTIFKFECALSDCGICSEIHDKNKIMTIDLDDSNQNVSANGELLSKYESLLSQLRSWMKIAHQWRNEKSKVEETFSSEIQPYKMLSDNYREFLKVEEKLEQHRCNDIKLLNEIVEIQSRIITKLQEKKTSKHNAAKRFGVGRYNLRETTALETVDDDEDPELLFIRRNDAFDRLSTKNSSLKRETEELKRKHDQLKQCLNKCLDMIDDISSSSSSSELMKRISDQRNEEALENRNKLTQLIQEEFECAICREILVDTVITDCNHTFCKSCLLRWEKENPSFPRCAFCRNAHPKNMNAAVIDSFLGKVMPFLSTPVMQAWEQVYNERQALKSVNLKKRKHDSNDDVVMQGRTLIVNLDEDDDSLDESLHWREAIINLRNVRRNMGSRSFVARPTSQVPGSFVVDLTED